jgi:hypothetical protein
MADYRAISTGNYSDLARWEVWNGSAWVAATQLPTVADDVYANSYTVTIDIDSFASSYRTTGISGVAASGGFVLNGGITATGDVLAGGSRCLTHSDSTDSYVIGDSFGATGQPPNSGTDGIRGTGDGTLHLIGSCQNGTGTANNPTNNPTGIRSTGTGSFIVYGDAIAISNGSQQGIAAYALGSQGKVLGSAVGINSNNALAAFNCEVNVLNGKNSNCVVTGKFIINPTPDYINCVAKDGNNVLLEIFNESGNAVVHNSLLSQNQASQSDVRLGTSYANGALTGTLAVPNPATVSLGVPTDNTTGTMPTSAVVAADLLNELSTSSNALAERLRNVSTVQTTGTQISALTILP